MGKKLKVEDIINQLINKGYISYIPYEALKRNDEYIWIKQLEDFPISYSFSDIALAQGKNPNLSRLDTDISSEIIKGVKVKIPLMAANMSTVINSDFYIKLHKLGAFAVLHRAKPFEEIIQDVEKVSKECEWVSASIGTDKVDGFGRQIDALLASDLLIKAGANILVIDIAHGYCDPVISLVKDIRKYWGKNVKIVVGNTINPELLLEVADIADAVKVGIGQGSACETANTAGCTEKQFSAVLKFKELAKKLGMPIISDGGIKEPSDFTKAIAAGASGVMAGKIFAACPESAAFVIGAGATAKKVYAGMASRYVQDKWKGGLKKGTCPEGKVTYIDIGEDAENLLERYSGALRTGLCYVGAKNIAEMHEKAKFIRLK